MVQRTSGTLTSYQTDVNIKAGSIVLLMSKTDTANELSQYQYQYNTIESLVVFVIVDKTYVDVPDLYMRSVWPLV